MRDADDEHGDPQPRTSLRWSWHQGPSRANTGVLLRLEESVVGAFDCRGRRDSSVGARPAAIRPDRRSTVGAMQPFERLRALARWHEDDDTLLASEAAECLSAFDGDPAGLVVSCRRLLAHHAPAAALWWVCARVLCAPDGPEAAWAAWRLLRDDQTAARLSALLPFPHDDPMAVFGRPATLSRALAERPDLDTFRVEAGDGLSGVRPSHLLVEARAVGGNTALVAEGAGGVIDSIRDQGGVVWLVAPTGRLLPPPALRRPRRRSGSRRVGRSDRRWSDVERIAGPTGLDTPARIARRVDCPVGPELLRQES